VYDVVRHEGQPVLVMEYLPSRSLAELIADRGRLAPREVAWIGAQAAAGLAAAHAAGIVHRDVKPGNILLAEDGAVKITDFGIARADGDATVTRTGLLAGTPAFLSPEAARGAEPGPASDVFSLGATLYAAVEGHPPFGADGNPIALLHAVAAGQITPPQHAGSITEPLLNLLRLEPAARPAMVQVGETMRAAAGEGRGPDAPTQAMTLPAPTRPGLPPLVATRGGAARTGPSRRLIYTAVALIAAVALGALLANAIGGPDGGSGRPAASGPTTAVTSAVEPAALERAVDDYYALLPDDTDTAWTMLGPGMHARGKEEYEKFWHDVEDRGRFRESHELGMVVRDGRVLIDSDRVVSSVQIDGEDGGHKKKGGN